MRSEQVAWDRLREHRRGSQKCRNVVPILTRMSVAAIVAQRVALAHPPGTQLPNTDPASLSRTQHGRDAAAKY